MVPEQAPRLRHGGVAELAVELGLATGDDRDVVGVAGHRSDERLVGCRVAGVQRDHEVNPLGQRRLGDAPLHRLHAGPVLLGRDLSHPFHQFGARLERQQGSAPDGLHQHLEEREAEVGFAGSSIDDHRLVVAGVEVGERRIELSEKVGHLLQFAVGIGVRPTPLRDEAKRLAEFHRGAGVKEEFADSFGVERGPCVLCWLGHEGLRGTRMRRAPR